MLSRIKNKITQKLKEFLNTDTEFSNLKKISPLLYASIKEFVLRKGKLLRPMLFVIGYLGYARKEAPGLYASSLSVELLHDFMLIHDDIVDKSSTRRGKPSMHKALNDFLCRYHHIKFSGEDLSIVAGDIVYALAIKAFLSIREDAQRKEQGLKQLIKATIYTGTGEFIELISGIKPIAKIQLKDIYTIYDYKTGNYTFSAPLSIGALLAGAGQRQTKALTLFGIYLGRAFQIKDDILGMFGDENKTGKSTLSDLQEAKRTILIWYAYHNGRRKDRVLIDRIFSKKKVTYADLTLVRSAVDESGALEYAKGETRRFSNKANNILKSSEMKNEYRQDIFDFLENILKV